MRQGLITAIIVFCAMPVLLWSSDCHCAEKCSVAIHYAKGYEAFFLRLQAEVRIAGFDTVRKTDSEIPADDIIDTPDTADTALASVCAFVVIRRLSETVTLYYRPPDDQLLRTEMPLPVRVEEEQVTALHIAELLRVTLHAPQQKPPPPSKVVTTIPIEQSRRRRADSLTGQLGVNLVWGLGNGPPQLGVDGDFGFRIHRSVFASVFFMAPLRAVSLTWPEGSARFHLWNAGVNVGISSSRGWIRPVLRLGYTLWYLKAAASSLQGFEGFSETRLTSGPSLYAGGIFAIRQTRIGVALEGMVSVITLKTEYTVVERPVATVGHLLTGVFLGLVWLPGTERK
ncbi:MAG: hypothetical protein JXX14_04020 [Deltaproteobacteria bacterium]|nr:hypothetical protein [Deltaproteobacteria bacterium]